MADEERLTMAPEIAQLRALLRAMGADNAAERESIEAEAVGVARLVGALVQCVSLERTLREGGDGGAHLLDAMLARALAIVAEDGGGGGGGGGNGGGDVG